MFDFLSTLCKFNIEIFVNSYKALYKAISAPEADVEDFQRWMEISVNACKAIEEILTDKNLPRSKKYSLETSLGHFIGIQLELAAKIKQGGELAQEKRNLEEMDNAASAVSDIECDSSETESVKWSEIDSAFKNRIKTGVITNIKHLDFDKFMSDAKVLFEEQIQKALLKFDSIKVNGAIVAKYVILKVGIEDQVDTKQFNTKNISIFKTVNLSEDMRQTLSRKMREFQEQGSGWSLQCLLHLTVNINKYNPVRAGSLIPLPNEIKNRRACVNVKNDDNECF